MTHAGIRHRHYSAEERATAVGIALSEGAVEAGRRLGISHRTISHWLARPDTTALVARSREAVAAKLWEAVTVGTDAVLAGLRDDRARLGDKATALRVVTETYALLTGGPTSRTENLNVNATEPPMTDGELGDLRRYLSSITEEELDLVVETLRQHRARRVTTDGMG